MSSMPSIPFIEEVFISTYLNSVLLGTLLMGVYSVVYFSILYLYLSKDSRRQWIIIAVISISYILYVTQAAGQWFLLKDAVVDKGATRQSLFTAILTSPIWVSLLTSISSYVLAFLADSLLIWRCFNVWNRSLRVILLPSVTLFAESAIILNRLIAAGLFLTLGTSVITTLLISYRIYSVAGSKDAFPGSRRRFKHIVEILVESAAAYSAATIMLAIVSVLPQTSSAFAPLLGAQDMISVLYIFTAGCAPTVMVARVALADKNTDVPVHISAIQFQTKSTALGTMNFKKNSFDSESSSLHQIQTSGGAIAK
ncbi:hypothetical protein CPB84DRAFT_1964531 [Gymnopilus junonius]|uniref:Uncharacterized protein n=1 Tax=Gymnopilus junonius TaxID=109634 RepID=A0A9P5NIB3_GYMJU|nr:hypothetical protein CPB84DRAFT_1964531 [Gymnopilus junonius]